MRGTGSWLRGDSPRSPQRMSTTSRGSDFISSTGRTYEQLFVSWEWRVRVRHRDNVDVRMAQGIEEARPLKKYSERRSRGPGG